MASASELQLVLTAQDRASSVMRAFAGVMSSVVVGALSEAARAAAADEANVSKLRVAVENTGAAWEENVALIAARIKAGQDLAFTDDAVRDSIAQLTTATGDVNKAMEMQGLVMDIARGRQVDLATATDIAQKAALGQFGALKRMGIVLAEGSTATEALGELQKRYANQATTYGDSTSASIFKVKDSIDEWKESIGGALGPAQTFVALLPGISAGFAGISAALGLLTPAQVASAKASMAMIAPWLLVIATAVLVVAALLQVYETVKVVTDNWDIFVYALKRGDLNEIPLFGFFFQKAQQVIGLISTLQTAWNNLQILLGQRVAVGEYSGMVENRRAGGMVDGFAEGGIVPGPVGAARLIMAHGGERVQTREQQSGASSGVTFVFNAPIYGMQDFEDTVARVVRDKLRGGGFRGVLA